MVGRRIRAALTLLAALAAAAPVACKKKAAPAAAPRPAAIHGFQTWNEAKGGSQPSGVRAVSPIGAGRYFIGLDKSIFMTPVDADEDAAARKERYQNDGVDLSFDPTMTPAEFERRTLQIIAEEQDRQADMAKAMAAPFPQGYDPLGGIDLSAYDSPVREQGSSGACTAFAVISALESILGGEHPSRLALSVPQQWGLQGKKTSITEALNATIDSPGLTDAAGTRKARVTRWSLLTEATPPAGGKPHKLADPDPVIQRLTRTRKPVIGVFRINDSWYAKNGIVRSVGALNETVHAVLVVGVLPFPNDPDQTVMLFKNSWGTDWGQKGYGIVPFKYCNDDYAQDKKMYCAFYALDGELVD